MNYFGYLLQFSNWTVISINAYLKQYDCTPTGVHLSIQAIKLHELLLCFTEARFLTSHLLILFVVGRRYILILLFNYLKYGCTPTGVHL